MSKKFMRNSKSTFLLLKPHLIIDIYFYICLLRHQKYMIGTEYPAGGVKIYMDSRITGLIHGDNMIRGKL